MLADLQTVWEDQARVDPLWAILSDDSKQGRRWHLDRFLATGERQVAVSLKQVADRGIAIRTGAAVDFGCGIGRLTQPLGRRFDHTIGVDIAPTMLNIARAINPYPDRVEFILNRRDNLGIIKTASADFLMSHATLQHIEPEIAERYLREFFRVLRPGGVMIFSCPSHLVADEVAGGAPGQPRPAGPRPGEIPAEASAAHLRFISVENEVVAGREFVVRLSVENASSITWRQSESLPLNVGNRWLTAGGDDVVVYDDGRSPMPSSLAPGQKTEIELAVVAPRTSGRYTLEIDLVQEGVRWFSDAGSTSLRTSVDVASGAQDQAVPPDKPYEFRGLIEDELRPALPYKMHGIRKERVLAILDELGGELIACDEDGDSWRSYRYFVRVPGRR
jgi:SAM-dependent methyltransferase